MPKRKDIMDELKEVSARLGITEEHLDLLTSSKSSKEDIILLMAELAKIQSIDLEKVKRRRIEESPSSASEKWAEIAPTFKLPEDINRFSRPGLQPLAKHEVPECLLPPSFHRGMLTTAWRALDAYGDVIDQRRGATRLRALEPYMTALLGLFQGRIVDMPGSHTPDCHYTTDGEVAHEIFVLGGALLVVVGYQSIATQAESLAHLFLKLLSAAEHNRSARLSHLQIYGVLTNLEKFEFYSYDPIERSFTTVENIFLGNLREDFCYGMMKVANKIFSILMSGYLDAIDLARVRETTQAFKDKAKPPGRDLWERARNSASLAQSCFQKDYEDYRSLTTQETNGSEGLSKLAESLTHIPRQYELIAQDDPTTSRELEVLAYDYVSQWHANNYELDMPKARYVSVQR